MDGVDAIPTGDQSPSSLFGDLFPAVAMMNILPPKDWADAIPKSSPAQILEAFRTERPQTPTAMLAFVRVWFDLPREVTTTFQGVTLESHIEATWPALVRPASPRRPADSLLPLPQLSLAPGGRFRECYYWDSYFSLIGLRHRPDLIRAGAENCRWLIEQYGFVPNANRTYYLSRSQPPFFFKIVELLAEVESGHVISEFLPALIAEHHFWMDGAQVLQKAGEAFRRVVRLPDGAILNRYWDDVSAPRDEAYMWDVEAARSAPDRTSQGVYRDIRAACESGWDFSSRWLGKAGDFSSIMTTSLLPSDLNSILFGLERFIADALAEQGTVAGSDHYAELATRRRDAMCRHLWNEELGAFDDFDWKTGQLRGMAGAAAAAPLFFGLADTRQARATATFIKTHLLAPGGVLTTTQTSDLQWDSPNGWAPLQWIAFEGLTRYGFDALAADIRDRWLNVAEHVFRVTGRMIEKYDIVNLRPGGGGEYALQDGFGWTNGVIRAFLDARATSLSRARPVV